MNEKQMIKSIEKIKMIERAIKEDKKIVDSLKDSIREDMDFKMVEKMEVGDYKISYVEVQRENFDKKTFKKEKPKTYSRYVSFSNFKRFSIY